MILFFIFNFYLEQELFIAERLEMTVFDIEIEAGSWNIEIILSYLRRLQEKKCTCEIKCDREIYAINKEDGKEIWYNHFLSLTGGESEIKEKYDRINDIVRSIENTIIEFQDTFINAKATIAIFRSNKASLMNYHDLMDEINKAEIHLDSQITRTIMFASETFKVDNYQTYQLIKREMDLMISDIEKIHNLCKQAIYKIFNDNLMQTLNDAWNDEDDNFIYDPHLFPLHPIFGQKLSLFSIVCQNSK